MNNRPTLPTMVVGLILFLAALAAWLYAADRDINTDILWAVIVPILTALFVGHQVSAAAENAQKAADQTNGTMNERIKSVMIEALAERDAARTWQAQQNGNKPSINTERNTK